MNNEQGYYEITPEDRARAEKFIETQKAIDEAILSEDDIF